MQQGLAALRVVDLSTGIPGGYCSRLLADAGADVVKVEPPGGDPWRAWSSGGATVDPEHGGALFQFLHHGMRSVVGRPGDAEVEALVAGGRRRHRQLPPLRVRRASRGSTRTPGSSCARSRRTAAPGRTPSVRPPSSSCRRSRAGSSGAARCAACRSRPAGAPASGWRARSRRMAVAAAARRAQRTGRGDHIDFSIAEVMTIAASSYADYMRALVGNPPIVGARRTIETPSVEPTLDGYVGFCTNSRQQFHSFLLLIDRPDLIDGDPWSNQMDRQRGWDEWNDIVHAWTPHHTTADIVRLRQRAAHPRRAGAQRREHPRVRPLRRPQRVRRRRHEDVQDAASPVAHRRRGPAAAASGAAARRAHRQRSSRTPGPQPTSIGPDELPLAGVRVLDLTAWWAGPIAAGALAALGADVIHVESISRIDGMRATGAGTGMEGAWWERSAHYLCSNTNKRDLTLDLGTDDGLAMLRRLIGESDAVLENFSPRVLGNFGLDWEKIHEINPRCLLVRMPAFGLSGPWRDNVGFAQTMEQVTGMAWITGHVDDQPRIQQGPSDPNAGMHAAFALHRRSRRTRSDRARQPARGHDGRRRAQRRLRAGAREDRVRQPARTRREPQPERRAARALPRTRGRDVARDLGRDRRAVGGAGRGARTSRVGDRVPTSRPTPAGAPATTSSTRTWASGPRRRTSSRPRSC